MSIKNFLNFASPESLKDNMKNNKHKKSKTIEELLMDLLIIELAKARIPQLEIQKILGVDIHRINRIAKYFKSRKK